MNPYILTALDNDSILQGFDAAVVGRSRMNAVVLAYLAEMDARHLYLKRGFESMKALCMARFGVTEDSAKKHIQVARVGRQFPVLFQAIASEALTPYAVRLLAPRLNPENVDSLITECAGRTGDQIGIVLARRFPVAESLRLDDGVTLQFKAVEESTQPVAAQKPDAIGGAVRHLQFVKPRPKVAALSEDRFTLTVTLSRVNHDKLRRLQELLSHSVPNGDIAQVLERAMDALLAKLERKKFGTGTRRGRGTTRAIPAHVRKAVYDRDGGRCTQVSEDGSRCGSRERIEFDHIVPVAKGGNSTVANLRLLCRAHNQYAAEQAFGQKFIEEKKLHRRARV